MSLFMEVCVFVALEIEVFTYFKEIFLYYECLKSDPEALFNKTFFYLEIDISMYVLP